MNKVEMKAVELNNDINEVKKELKRIASVKSRLKRQRGKSTFEKEMNEVLSYENLLKEVRDLLSDKSAKSVPQYTEEDVQSLSYDETIKAIKSIQSKKSLSKWLTDVEGDNDEYRNACRVESLLRAHKATLQPIDDSFIKKNDLREIVDRHNELSKEELVTLLEALL